MKRIFDIIMSVTLLIISIPICILIVILIKRTSEGPILYWSERSGRAGSSFMMPKFRTMIVGTPVVASHLLEKPDVFLTSVGRWLRATSLDELPQLYSVVKGHMSLVGPRPALCSQYDLIGLRESRGVNKLLPGITGWAQINGRDNLSLEEKSLLDEFYLNHQSFMFDVHILLKTIVKVIVRNGVSH